MRKTYLYKTKMNKQTESNCNQWLEICRILYNLALEQKIIIYRQYGESISTAHQMTQLLELKKAFSEFAAVGSQVLQDVILRLDKAYKFFFQRVKQKGGKAGFPRFKSKISNQRKDFLHKVSNFYIKAYNTIYIENLNIKNMMQNRHLSRDISDSSWGMFFNLLSYKAEGAGRTIIKVTPNGTSQICSGCGEKVPKSLSVRIHKCSFCNLILDRDYNASLNIKALGQGVQMLTAGLPAVVCESSKKIQKNVKEI